MNASVVLDAPVPTLKESGYEGFQYMHTDLKRAPVTFMWWAKTPSGRQSKFVKTWTFYRLDRASNLAKHNGALWEVAVPSQHYRRTTPQIYEWLRKRGHFATCPRLPKGYEWQGPFLYSDLPAPTQEGEWGPMLFRFTPPATSAGYPIRYVATLEQARPLALQILAQRAGVA